MIRKSVKRFSEKIMLKQERPELSTGETDIAVRLLK
jgi:hypothetical protein